MKSFFSHPGRGAQLLRCAVFSVGLWGTHAWAADAGDASSAAGAVNAAAADSFARGAGFDISRADMDVESLRVPVRVRSITISDPASVEIMAKNLYLRRALTASAEAAGLAQDAKVATALRLARERVLSEAWLERAEAAALPDAAALEAYARTAYQADTKRFMEPEQWQARHILIAVKQPQDEAKAKERAEKLLQEVQQGADFAALARKHSDDPGSAAKGGELGYFARGRMVKPFEDAVTALDKPGDVSPLVHSKFGYHIIQLEGHRAAGVRPYLEVREQLLDEARARLRTEARQRAIDAGIKDMHLNQSAIEALAAQNKASQPDIALSPQPAR